jgi:hypothetical protein
VILAELPSCVTGQRRSSPLPRDSSRGKAVREYDDFGFIVMQFLCKQMQHAEALLILDPRVDLTYSD